MCKYKFCVLMKGLNSEYSQEIYGFDTITATALQLKFKERNLNNGKGNMI